MSQSALECHRLSQKTVPLPNYTKVLNICKRFAKLFCIVYTLVIDKEKRIMKNKKLLIAGLTALMLAGCSSAADPEPAADSEPKQAEKDETAASNEVAPVEEEKDEKKEDSNETGGQTNAVKKAESYLDYTAFSRSGLIEQLEYEGFSTEDATYAVDKVNPDWNEQAAKKAQDYLDYTSFSLDGLIEQLEYEGFTPEQAQYGADKAYN